MDKSQINHDILGYTTIIPYHTILAASPTIIPSFFPSFFPSYLNIPIILP